MFILPQSYVNNKSINSNFLHIILILYNNWYFFKKFKLISHTLVIIYILHLRKYFGYWRTNKVLLLLFVSIHCNTIHCKDYDWNFNPIEKPIKDLRGIVIWKFFIFSKFMNRFSIEIKKLNITINLRLFRSLTYLSTL